MTDKFDWDNPFKPEDFEQLYGQEILCIKHKAHNCFEKECENGDEVFDRNELAAEFANASFRELIKEHGKKMYSSYGCFEEWWDSPDTWPENNPATHEAILICVKEIS